MEGTVETGTSVLTALVIWVIVGAIAGWLAGMVVKGGGFGFVGNAVLGIVGAVVAGWIFKALGIAAGGILGSIIAAAIGAIIVLLVIGLIRRA